MPTSLDKTLLDSVEYMALRGFHGATIAKATGLTVSQVRYRTGALKIALRAYRDGVTAEAVEIINVTPCAKQHVKAVHGKVYAVLALVK